MSFHSRTGYLVVGMGGKTQIHTAHILNRSFSSEPFTLSAWFRNLERCIISFRPQGLRLVSCSINLLKGVNAPPRIPYDLSGVTGSQREVGAQLCL